MFPSLDTVHFQAMDLHGLNLPSLPTLRGVGMLDCQLTHADAQMLMRAGPNVERLIICGNPLGSTRWNNVNRQMIWPALRHLRYLDCSLCELPSSDEEQLAAGLPMGASAKFRSQPAGQDVSGHSSTIPPVRPGHVVFDSSESESETVCD